MTQEPQKTAPLMTTAEADNIRAMAKRIMSESGYSQSQFGKKAGIASSTFSQVINNKYSGDTEEILIKIRDFCDTHQRTREISEKVGRDIGWVPTPTAEEIMSSIDYCRALNDIVTITGKPGLGKSETAKEAAKRNHRTYYMVATPSISTPERLITELMDATYQPVHRSVSQNRQHLHTHLSGAISLLIIDEAQHLSAKALEELRLIHDKTNCGIVLMGNKTVTTRFAGSGKAALFAQMTSRIGMRLLLPSTPKQGDIDMLLDSQSIYDTKSRVYLTKIANMDGALRKMIKVVKLARMSRPSEEDNILPYLQMAAKRLTAGGVQL